MDRSNRPVRISTILGSAALGLLILLAMIGLGLVIVFSVKGLYSSNIDRWELIRISGMSREEIMENYSALMRWCWPWHTAELAFPTLKMSPAGAQHFAECKVLFNFFTIGGAAAFALAAVWISRIIRRAKGSLTNPEDALSRSRLLTGAGIVSLVVPVVLLAAAAADFDRTFVLFHQLFFGNDLWIFDYRTDPVILILPETYFLLCAVVISITVLAGGCAAIISGIALGKKIKKRSAAEA